MNGSDHRRGGRGARDASLRCPILPDSLLLGLHVHRQAKRSGEVCPLGQFRSMNKPQLREGDA